MFDLLFGGFYQCMRTLRAHEDSAVLISLGADKKVASLVTNIKENLPDLARLCAGLQLVQSQKRVLRVIEKLEAELTLDEIRIHLSTLRDIIHDEGHERYIFHIDPRKGEVLFRAPDRWQDVKRQFPSAKPDIASALNCYMFDENTACVFHLMRIAEHGLRALARERRVSIPKRPLEWANWRDIIRAIGQKSEAIANRRAGPARDAALEFYRGSLGEFEAFKDTYRNNVMHSRKTYDEREADSALFHVREFMTRLASKIDENAKQAIRWGRM
jgi:hypothetical protein